MRQSLWRPWGSVLGLETRRDYLLGSLGKPSRIDTALRNALQP